MQNNVRNLNAERFIRNSADSEKALRKLMKRTRLGSFLGVITAVIAVLMLPCITANAYETVTAPITAVSGNVDAKNEEQGWEWKASEKRLTLKDGFVMDIHGDQTYTGLNLKVDTTIELEGNAMIRTGYLGINALGNFEIVSEKGKNGRLTIDVTNHGKDTKYSEWLEDDESDYRDKVAVDMPEVNRTFTEMINGATDPQYPRAAGEYKISYKGKEQFAELTIEKRRVVVKGLKAKNKTYDCWPDAEMDYSALEPDENDEIVNILCLNDYNGLQNEADEDEISNHTLNRIGIVEDDIEKLGTEIIPYAKAYFITKTADPASALCSINSQKYAASKDVAYVDGKIENGVVDTKKVYIKEIYLSNPNYEVVLKDSEFTLGDSDAEDCTETSQAYTTARIYARDLNDDNFIGCRLEDTEKVWSKDNDGQSIWKAAASEGTVGAEKDVIGVIDKDVDAIQELLTADDSTKYFTYQTACFYDFAENKEVTDVKMVATSELVSEFAEVEIKCGGYAVNIANRNLPKLLFNYAIDEAEENNQAKTKAVILPLPSFYRSGYDLKGWKNTTTNEIITNEKLSAERKVGEDVNPAGVITFAKDEEQTFEAVWTPRKDINYRVEYYVQQPSGAYTVQATTYAHSEPNHEVTLADCKDAFISAVVTDAQGHEQKLTGKADEIYGFI